MAWLGDGLSSLSNLKGQITNFTKEVLSEGIVEEIDDRSKLLEETSKRCVELQEVLNSKDAEIALLRRQNCELQKTVVEFNARTHETTDSPDNDGGGFFWDPPTIKNRDKGQNQVRELQEKLAQATMRARELEGELEKYQKTMSDNKEDSTPESHNKTDVLRTKQDMVNRIIQIGEKGREAERNMKKLQLDESIFVNEFRAAISKLGSPEQVYLIRCALKALEIDNGVCQFEENGEKTDIDEKRTLATLKNHTDESRNANGVHNSDGDLKKKIRQLQEENKNLSTNIEELDHQHAQSIEKILSLKEDLQKKHHCLQTAYESLYADYTESQNQRANLEGKISSINNVEIQKQDRDIQTEPMSDCLNQKEVDKKCLIQEDKTIQTHDESMDIHTITQRVYEIMRNSNIDLEEDKTLFETIAERYVEMEWKKDLLDRKMSELTRELQQTNEIKESLQLECDELQGTVESLDMELQHIKSNLPSIPEVSEERVASLETETESMSQEIKQLQSECDTLRNKNSELITAMSNIEGSLRNQENLEAEVRNTKQQLEMAGQQLAGASKNVENNENMMEDMRRRLHTCLDENNELRRKIDNMELTEKHMQDELTMYSKKCKSIDDNIELIEELKNDISNTRTELKNSIENTKRLENELISIEDGKKEVERDILALSQEKEQLEIELSILQKNGAINEDNDILKELRKQLEMNKREKDDLEYDLMNMRKELDFTVHEGCKLESQNDMVTQENEKLTKETNALTEQFKSASEEWLERMGLLQNEITLLQQEYTFLQEEAQTDKLELNELRMKIENLEEKKLNYEKSLKSTESEYENLKSRANMVTDLEDKLKIAEDNLQKSIDKCKQQDIELIDLRENIKSLSADQQEMKIKLQDFENNYDELEKELAKSNSNNASLNSNSTPSEILHNLRETLESKKSKIDTLVIEKTELTSKLMACQQELQTVIDSSKESTAMAKETVENLSQIVKQRDEDIELLKLAANKDLATTNAEYDSALKSIQAERDELIRVVQIKHNESLQYHGEIQRLTQLYNEQASNLQTITTERETNENLIKEKDAQILWAQNELQVVRQRLKKFEESNNYGETCNVVEHSTKIAQASILNEKCNALEAALVKEQSNNRILQDQLTDCQQRENAAAKELERLRSHLVEMEANHTEEALLLEQNKKTLEVKVLQAEETLKNNSTLYTSANIRANQQVETLQQQMALIVQQRDEIQTKLSAAEDKVLAHAASLINLQIVLEQFQRDKENDIRNATEKIREQLNNSYKKHEELYGEITTLKGQLTEAKECLLAASRLSEQLDKKSERIRELNEEVLKLKELVNTADERIQQAQRSGEGKVDKSLIKNLLLGFLSSSATDKSSVLRVFSTILDFNDIERDKAGLNHPTSHGGWFSGLLNSNGSTKDQEASLSAAFVRFLESESKPIPPIPPLPISNTNISRPGHSRQHSTSSSHSGLLLSNIALPSFPDFVPSRNTGSILKEVLKDS